MLLVNLYNYSKSLGYVYIVAVLHGNATMQHVVLQPEVLTRSKKKKLSPMCIRSEYLVLVSQEPNPVSQLLGSVE